ncbi:hypothetical protein OKW33_006235 [Paraburkholderia atlantica]
MVSASAFWNPKTGRFRIPEATDLTEIDFALDSAGFTAMRLFQSKGRQRGIAGVYPWTMEQFVELASFSGATWVSQPDLCLCVVGFVCPGLNNISPEKGGGAGEECCPRGLS